MISTRLHTRPAAAAAQKAGQLWAVASGKGGVGKTWFAITLAHAMARHGRRVLLVDGDLGLANIDVQLGLPAMPDLANLLADETSLEQAIHPHPAGFGILAGRSGCGDLSAISGADLDRLCALLLHARRHYDLVLIDLGAGLEAAVRRLACLAETLLVIATDDPTSITDAYATLKLHAQDRGVQAIDTRLVINCAGSRAEGERTHATLARACKMFLGHTPRLLGVVRRDDKVKETLRRQALLLTRHPSCPAAQDVEEIAARIAEGEVTPRREA